MATKKSSAKAEAKVAKKTPAKKAASKAEAKPAKKAAAPKAATKPAGAPPPQPVKPAKGTFHILDEGQKAFLPTKDAREVKLKGFEAFRFFLHRTPQAKGWTVSEASSGGRVSSGATQTEAKSAAQEILAKQGAEKLAECVEAAVRKNGAAPGFEKTAPAKAKPAAAESESAKPTVTQKLKSRILAALVDSKMLARPQVHFDEIAKAVGAPVSEVAEALMILELQRQVVSLPGKFFRLPKGDEGPVAKARGRKREGNSQIDIAARILKDAGEPLTCKEIVHRMFEQKLWTTSGRTPGATLSASIQREIAKRGAESRFRKVERGLYGLNE